MAERNRVDRAYDSNATKKSRKKMYADAAAGDPDAQPGMNAILPQGGGTTTGRNRSRPSQLTQIQKTPGTTIVRGVFAITAVPANPYISAFQHCGRMRTRRLYHAESKFKAFSDNLNKVGKGMKDFLKPVIEGFKAVENVGQKTMDVVKKGLTGFAAAETALAGFGTSAVKVGMNFDATMSKVAAISGKVSDEDFEKITETAKSMGLAFEDTGDATSTTMNILRAKALEMGAATQFSASEAAEALTYMSMAGWKAQDMLGGIGGIMNLAAASGEDLALTSDIVTDALTAFGMKANESGHFADILAAASSNANTNVGMMGETFKYVAPVAGAMGYTAEDTALAIGLIANSGIKASQAGTTLRGILSNLASPTDTVALAMDELGISLDDGSGNMKTFRQVMDDLRSGFGDLMVPQEEFRDRLSKLNGQLDSGEISQKAYDKELERLIELSYGAEGAQRAQYASMLAGKEAMSGLLAIVSAAPEDYEKLANAIDNCKGGRISNPPGMMQQTFSKA